MVTLFETDKIKVYKNSFNDVVHLNKTTGVSLKIKSNSKKTTLIYDLDASKLDKIESKYSRVISSPTNIKGMNAFEFERIDFN